MKKTFYFIIALIIIIFLSVFVYFIFESEEPVYSYSKNIDYSYIENQMRCFTPLGADGIEFIINSQEELKLLEERRFPSQFCENVQLPNIDFNTATLLGKTTVSCGCNIIYSRSVYKNEESKEMIYSIVIKSEGTCEIAATAGNWILIDKIPSDYEVKFEVGAKGDC